MLIEHDGDKNLAVSLAQAARRGLPNAPNTADTLGWAYYYEGAYESAIPVLESAVQASPENATYHYHLGLAYQKAGNFEDAKEQFERSLKLNPPASEVFEIRDALSQNTAN